MGGRRRPRRNGPAAVDEIRERIGAHLEYHDEYLAFSGGKDSLVDLARRVCPEVPVVFFDSGPEHPETYDYDPILGRAWSLDLHEVLIHRPGGGRTRCSVAVR